jgi:DNA-binding transcriptional MocR family regulator
MPRRTGDEIRQQIIALRGQSLSIRSVAAALGISPSTVQRVIHPSAAAKHRQTAKDRRAKEKPSPPATNNNSWLDGWLDVPENHEQAASSLPATNDMTVFDSPLGLLEKPQPVDPLDAWLDHPWETRPVADQAADLLF